MLNSSKLLADTLSVFPKISIQDSGSIYLIVRGSKQEAQSVSNSLHNNGITKAQGEYAINDQDGLPIELIEDSLYYLTFSGPEKVIKWLACILVTKLDPTGERLTNSPYFKDFCYLCASREYDNIPRERMITFQYSPELAYHSIGTF